MYPRSKASLRLLGFGALGALLMLTLACINRPMKNAPPVPIIVSKLVLPQSAERDVDILFIIDNSGSMQDEQENLRAQFPALMQQLRNMVGGLPNVHIGVTSTDLGTGAFGITYCDTPGGDAGVLQTGNCANPSGANFIVDVEPTDCPIERDPQAPTQCTSHACSQANCPPEDNEHPATTFQVDAETGCPRCRNYANESLEDVFGCIANLGTLGCGFEQPLEAMYKALDSQNAGNRKFIRENAYLAIVWITDEDDCSASNPQLFDNTMTGIDTTLGPLTSYRCFEFGITCDINSRTHQGTRHNCVPRDDAAALLHPLDRYIQRLQQIKDPSMLVVASIAGPVTPSPSGVGHDAVVGLDDLSNPDLQPSCTTGTEGAVPGIRLFNLMDAFNEEEDLAEWAYSSICSADYTPALVGIGKKISGLLDVQCLPAPLKGCSDPGVEFGSPQMPNSCLVNSRCLADCVVEDVFERNTDSERRYAVPSCLSVLSDGTIDPDNVDRTLAYASGHPAKRDAGLPVEACWHINYQPRCPQSNGAEIVVARRNDPPPRSFSEVGCQQIPRDEQICTDMQDNDEDCLVDMDDPCCINPANCQL